MPVLPVQTHRTVSALEPDDITLHRRLTGLRRRARTILLARYLLVAFCLVAAAGSVAALWPILVPAMAWAAALVVAGGSVVALALMRTPDTREVAASVDRRLHLADATVTALSLRGSRDPIARLIVRGAITRMTDERMASVFPFELGRPVISVVGAAVVCVAVMAGINRWPQASMFSSGGGMRIASSGGQAPQSQRSPGAAEGSDDQAGSRTTTASQSAPATTSAEAGASVPNADAMQRGVADSKAERSTGLTARSEDRPNESRADQSSTSQAKADPGRLPSNGSGSTAASVSVAGSTSSGRDGSQTGAVPESLAARSGGAGGRAPAGDARGGSGGVQRGSLQPGGATVATPSSVEYGVAYRTAQTRVDAAIARDEIPRSRRAYVRDYFLAIAPRD